MDPRLQLRVQRYGWDAAAPLYEDLWRGALAPAQARLMAMAAPAAGDHVLELACGTGLVTRPLAEAVGTEGRVLATDLAQAMVDLAAERLGGLPQVSTARMNAEALDLPDDSFDLTVCALGLMYVPDPVRAVAEMARVTRPGGRVAASVWGERRKCGWADLFPIVDARVASEVCPMFFGTGVPGALRRAFDMAGLTDVSEVREETVLRFSDEKTLLDAMFLGGPVALAVKRFDDPTRREAGEEFLASVAEWRLGDGGYAIPGEFVTTAGRA